MHTTVNGLLDNQIGLLDITNKSCFQSSQTTQIKIGIYRLLA